MQISFQVTHFFRKYIGWWRISFPTFMLLFYSSWATQVTDNTKQLPTYQISFITYRYLFPFTAQLLYRVSSIAYNNDHQFITHDYRRFSYLIHTYATTLKAKTWNQTISNSLVHHVSAPLIKQILDLTPVKFLNLISFRFTSKILTPLKASFRSTFSVSHPESK